MADGLLGIIKNFFVAPNWYPLVPILGFVAIAAASVGLSSNDYSDNGSSTGVGAWPAPMALSLGLLGGWVALGNYTGNSLPLFAYTIIATSCGILAANRGLIRNRLSGRGLKASVIRDAACLAVGIIATMMTLELSWNTSFPLLDPLCFFIELGLITCIILALYFLAQRSSNVVWVAVLLAGIAGTCQYFLAKFKGVAILPSDLLAMPTAFKVKEGYAFILDGRGLWGPMAGCVAMLAFSLLGELPTPDKAPVYSAPGRRSAQLVGGDEEADVRSDKARKVLKVLLNLALCAGFSAIAVSAMTGPDYIHDLGVTMDYGKSLESYKKDGFLTGFVAAVQDFPISVPKGYGRTKATELQSALDNRYEDEVVPSEWHTQAAEQFSTTPPSIIMVLNESFADLSMIDGMGCGYEGPAYFKSIGNALVRGNLAVSVIGGGTCNTEFELLTGNNYGFVGAGKYPYVTYQLKGDNLVAQLESLGYTTHAIHPNEASNWHRDEVYADMGFDEFLDIESFSEDAPQLHMGVTDATTYDKVIEILRVDPSPQFIFDVTMQNHGSYNLGNIPQEQQLHFEPKGPDGASIVTDPEAELEEGQVVITQEDVDAMNEYLACIQASDQDLKGFIDKLSKLDRRVVLVFFGDHQPAFTPLFNDTLFPDEADALAHEERVYQTQYFIWANYDIAGVEQKSSVQDASADMLGAMTLNLIGAPLSSYEKARVMEREGIVAINAFGYLGADGVWYAPDDTSSPYAENYQEMAMLNYLNFGSRVSPL